MRRVATAADGFVRTARASLPALLTVLLLCAGTVSAWHAGTHLAHAAGLAGTPGRLRVETCAWERTGGGTFPLCSGFFSSDDGNVVDRPVTLREKLPTGHTVPMRETASGTYEHTGLAAMFGWLAVFLLGVLLLHLALLLGLRASGRPHTPRIGLVLLGWSLAAVLLSALVGAVAELTGAP